MSGNAHLRLWPWSQADNEIVILTTGSDINLDCATLPLLELEENCQFFLTQKLERFTPLGSAFPASTGSRLLYNLPCLALAKNAAADARKMSLRLVNGANIFQATLELSSLKPAFADNAPSRLALAIRSWSQAFEDLLEYCASESPRWHELTRYLNSLSGDRNEPRMALIVKISAEITGKLPELAKSARKILLRTRQMLPVESIREMDKYCVSWNMRQSGTSLLEKASLHGQKLLAIKRSESCDTLENRVFKDFLIRCIREARIWLSHEAGKHFQYSTQAILVRHFQNLASKMLSEDLFQNISALSSRPLPNYVLQNDSAYRSMWRYYQRLLRQEDEQGSSFEWQGRTWADICLLLCGVAMVSASAFAEQLRRSDISIFKEQRLGQRLVPGCEPGPFLIRLQNGKAEWVLNLVHSDQADLHLATRNLGQTGASFYFVIERIGLPEKRIIPVWAIHSACSTQNFSAQAAGISACNALKSLADKYRISLSGLIMASSLESEKATLHTAPNCAPVLELPVNPSRWSETARNLASNLTNIITDVLK